MEYRLLNTYVNYLKDTKGSSDNTIKNYKNDLIEFHDFLARTHNLNNIDADFYNKITLIDLHEFMSYLNTKGNCDATRNRKGVSMREYFCYLKLIKVIKENIAENLQLPKIQKKLPIYLTEQESEKLIDTVSKATGKFAIRDLSIVLSLLVLGLRAEELCSIKINDIHDNILKVIRKGNKQVELEIPDSLLEIYNQYLEFRKSGFCRIIDNEYLFLSRGGKKLEDVGLNKMIKKYLKLCGITRSTKITAHKMRHTAATLMLKHGANLREVQEFLSHENISTTQIYTHISDDDVTNAINKNPLAHIKINVTE